MILDHMVGYMPHIVALVDYKGRFGSKRFSRYYRGGMDIDLLIELFHQSNYNLEIKEFSETRFRDPTDFSHTVIYTSQEDKGYLYKGFIEDIIYGLEIIGCQAIPKFKYLRANNNKVFMEILRQSTLANKYQINCKIFGCLEEVIDNSGELEYPCVIKTASGACSKGVHLVKNKRELLQTVRKISRSRYLYEEMIDIGRQYRHKGYQKASVHRHKFIIQEFIPGLENDWKVLIYGDKYYILRRQNRPGDFRASGSGLFTFDEVVDTDILSAAEEIFHCFDVPMMSLDLAKDLDNKIHLIEMQFVYFGTTTLEKSPYYCVKQADGWHQIQGKSILEEEYTRSVVSFLKSQQK